jgi:DNA-binding response OmpR family regulator
MSGKIIAVVDDETFIVEMITMFLGMKGYTVRGVYSGKEGLILVQTEKPDVLLLDLMMPDIEGFEVASRLRAMPEFADLPIVIISARTDAESRKRAMDAGADSYLTKPLRMPEVLAEIERVLAASSR